MQNFNPFGEVNNSYQNNLLNRIVNIQSDGDNTNRQSVNEKTQVNVIHTTTTKHTFSEFTLFDTTTTSSNSPPQHSIYNLIRNEPTHSSNSVVDNNPREQCTQQ
jgi:hypothetical protein